MAKSNDYTGIRTTAVHAGETTDPATGASSPNITMSSTFVSDGPSGFSAHDLSEESPYLYSRWANPTVAMLEAKIARLEGTEACAAYASGMAAASAIFLTFLSAGDHTIVSDVSYAGVAELVRHSLPRMGIEVSLVDLSDLEALKAAIKPNTKLIHCESPLNPLMRLTDLAGLAAIAKPKGILTSVDSTFASPMGCNPNALGIDLVMHSATKYIGGHGDAVGGAVAGSRELISQLNTEATIHIGGVMSPFNAWLIARGAATLPIRMKAHEETAMAVAKFLEAHPKVTKVLYPGLESHPQHELAKKQMKNFSGMITFQVGDRATGDEIATRMARDLGIIHYAVSLGHHRTLMFWMPTDDLMESSFALSGDSLAAYRDYAGDGLFRLSIGLEDPEDLIADIARVLDA